MNATPGTVREPPASAYGRARAPRATAYVLGVLAVLLVIDGVDLAGSHATPAWRVPLYSTLLASVASLARFVPGAHGDALANPFSFVAIPALLIAPVGLSWKDMGLGPFRRDALRTAVIWVTISVVIVAAVVTFRFDTPAHVAARVASNVTTNGLSEEILFRGLVLGTLAPLVGAARANIVQALTFGALHFGLDMQLMHGNAFGALALGVLGQGTAGLLMGVIALRTGNVVVPSVLHDALDTLPI